MSDDLNPNFIFNGVNTELLSRAIKGEIDLMELAKMEMANRGMNADGEWVGFSKAKAELGVKETYKVYGK